MALRSRRRLRIIAVAAATAVILIGAVLIGGAMILDMSSVAAQIQRKVSQAIDDEWVADITKRGFDGKKLLQSARDLIAKHSKT